jgi:hypothetical protein
MVKIMEYHTIAREIVECVKRLKEQEKTLAESARERATTEALYRKTFAVEIMKLKQMGIQASIIKEVAHANIADIVLQRELQDSLFTAKRESIRALETEISAWQTIAKFYERN